VNDVEVPEAEEVELNAVAGGVLVLGLLRPTSASALRNAS